MCVHLFIRSLDKYFLSNHYVPGVGLGIEDEGAIYGWAFRLFLILCYYNDIMSISIHM